MKVIKLGTVRKITMHVEGARRVSKQVPISAADGSPSFSFRVFTIRPGGHTPYHTHPFEHLNYIIAGRGALVTKTGRERPVRKGDFALVLPNEKHQYRNVSKTRPLVMICAVPRQYE